MFLACFAAGDLSLRVLGPTHLTRLSESVVREFASSGFSSTSCISWPSLRSRVNRMCKCHQTPHAGLIPCHSSQPNFSTVDQNPRVLEMMDSTMLRCCINLQKIETCHVPSKQKVLAFGLSWTAASIWHASYTHTARILHASCIHCGK